MDALDILARRIACRLPRDPPVPPVIAQRLMEARRKALKRKRSDAAVPGRYCRLRCVSHGHSLVTNPAGWRDDVTMQESFQN